MRLRREGAARLLSVKDVGAKPVLVLNVGEVPEVVVEVGVEVLFQTKHIITHFHMYKAYSRKDQPNLFFINN